jgi:release factor glutamine methyltransferase
LSSLRKQGPGQPDTCFRRDDNPGFDLIVSNPPYIPSGDIPNLATEVRNHDPILALDGGKDGLQAYLVIIRETKRLLSPGGVCLLEVGIGQAPGVARLAADSGLSVSESIRDLAGIERVLKITQGDSGDN